MTNKTTEALKLAEEYLTGTKTLLNVPSSRVVAVVSAIREALAEQSLGEYHGKLMREVCNKVITKTLAEQEKQEPVIWHSVWDFVDVRRDPPLQGDEANWLPLYASPVSAPEQEPVAWKRESDGALFRFEVHEGLTPLYAAPVSVEAEWIETNKALAKEIIEQRNQYLDMLAEAVDLSVKAEREACAKVCNEGVSAYVHSDYTKGLAHGARLCAAAIRARGEK